MRQGDKPVQSGVGDGEDRSGEIEEGEVELLPQTGQVEGQRHAAQDCVLPAGIVLIDVGEIQVSVSPGLRV